MAKEVNAIWKEKEGSKNVWKVQATKGILTFGTKKQAVEWVEAITKGEKING